MLHLHFAVGSSRKHPGLNEVVKQSAAVVVDIPNLRDIEKPNPVLVTVKKPLNEYPALYQVVCESGEGSLRVRLTNFKYPPIKVWDQVLALQTFLTDEESTPDGI